MGGLLLVTNAFLLEFRAGGLFLGAVGSETTNAGDGAELPVKAADPDAIAAPGPDPQLLARVEALMEEGAYREMGLTIGNLAGQVEQPEYLLRRVINGGLGYRNFNDYLNRYRIREAAGRLGNTEEATVPVLTIALDVGFRSLSSFNKAFKEQLEMTPSAWRRRCVEGAEPAQTV